MAQKWMDCDWSFRTEVTALSTVTAGDRVVTVNLTDSNFDAAYEFTAAGAELRVLSDDHITPLDFHLEDWDATARTASIAVLVPSLTVNAPKTLFVYYGNNQANSTSSAVPDISDAESTYVNSGWRYHTRRSTVNPTNEAQARAVFADANDTPSYGCAVFDKLEGRNNRNTFNGVRRNYGLYAEALFEVTTPGTWSFRSGMDFGRGGAIYIDGAPLTERWNEDIWWAFNYSNSDVLSGSVYLDVGYHHYETLGFEGCCDGTITVQYLSPGSSTWLELGSDNINLVSAGCPVGEQSFAFVQTDAPNQIGGHAFLDNGDNGIAHNAVMEGSESGLAGLEVTVEVVNNGESKTVLTDATGSWQTCYFEEAVGSNVKVSVPISADHYSVSESVPVINSDPVLNAVLQFPVEANTNYLDLAIGLIEQPSLSSDNSVEVGAGLTGLLPHQYTPTSDSSVSFQVSELRHEQLGIYTYSVFQDLDCNGELDNPAVPMSNPVAAQVGQNVCIVIKVDGTTSVTSSSLLELRIDANTDFSGLSQTHNNTNTDLVTGVIQVKLVLDKTVCNAAQAACDLASGSGFTTNIEGKPEDEIVYRLEFSSLVETVNNVAVIDHTPEYTTLKPFSISVVSQPAGLDCIIVEPVDQSISNFSGTVKWQCDGQVDTSQSAVVAFSVLID